MCCPRGARGVRDRPVQGTALCGPLGKSGQTQAKGAGRGHRGSPVQQEGAGWVTGAGTECAPGHKPDTRSGGEARAHVTATAPSLREQSMLRTREDEAASTRTFRSQTCSGQPCQGTRDGAEAPGRWESRCFPVRGRARPGFALGLSARVHARHAVGTPPGSQGT